jgi:acetyltransferase-like isoleucine patch superfamily enzyme/acyl carrier protein
LKDADPNSSEVANLVARTTAKRASARRAIEACGVPFAPLIHPSVDMDGVEFGKDIVVYKNATVGPEVVLGEGSVVFMGACAGHESVVERGCVLAPSAVINARVHLGEGAYVGTNATVLPEVKVGSWATIAAGSVAMHDVPADATLLGVPGEIVMASRPEAEKGPFPLTSNGSFSLTSNGKVDRKRSPRNDNGKPEAEQAYVAPRNEIEKTVASIWSEVLGVDRVGVHDNFFQLGGHSLSTFRITFRIKQELGVDFPLQRLFHAPTVAELANEIENRLIKQADEDRLEDVFGELEQLSDEEARSILDQPV